MKVKVYAKLNLTLNVLGKQNGYHTIDSVVTSVDIFDVVEVTSRADKQVTVSGLDLVPTEQNVAYKAACAFVERFNAFDSELIGGKQQVLGCDIAIAKGIPMGAGMGGSSADAAAVIYALCKLCNVDVNSQAIHDLCAELGSDVNYMLHGGLAKLRGKGDDVEFCKLGSPMYFALTTFDTTMSTAEVYSQFDRLCVEQVYVNNNALIQALQKKHIRGIAECFNNHLQPAAVSLSDYACDYLQLCNKRGLQCNMTGSGSAFYVTCDNEQSARNAADLLNSHGFTTVVCRSVNTGIEAIS